MRKFYITSTSTIAAVEKNGNNFEEVERVDHPFKKIGHFRELS
jgi:hypothetical protein